MVYKEVVINIVDENDNIFCFYEGVYIIFIRENVLVFLKVYIVNVIDVDSGDNGKVVYVFVGGNVDNI